MTEVVHKRSKKMLNRILSFTLVFIMIATVSLASGVGTGTGNRTDAEYTLSGIVEKRNNRYSFWIRFCNSGF